MKIKVAVFFPHNPCPPRSGAHKRALEIFHAIKECGLETYFLSSPLWSDAPWTEESIQELKKKYVADVLLYNPTEEDKRYREEQKQLRKEVIINDFFIAPPRFRDWITTQVEKCSASFLVSNYVLWDGLIDHRNITGIKKIIDTHEIATLQMPWEAELRKYSELTVKPKCIEEVHDLLLDESFFEKLSTSPQKIEFETYDNYDVSIAISQEEYEIIKRNTKKTTPLYLPATHEVVSINNTYFAPPILPIGPNPINTQGYYYFAKRVLPLILKEEKHFTLDVTGSWCDRLLPVSNIMLHGFVNDLNAMYQKASFLLCPIYGGTGQQVKVVEAMAHGLPVVLLTQPAKSSPVIHGHNGFIANNAEEFALYSLKLWGDRNLCRQLGKNAKETIEKECSRKVFLEEFKKIFN